MEVAYVPIGVIRTPHAEPEGSPIQPTGAMGVSGRVEVFAPYRAGLADLGGFSHLYLLYHFHRVHGFELTVRPFLDPEPRGVFATRSPPRPNPIGLSVVRLVRIEDGVLEVEDVDMLDGTPLLDIKPYVPDFDHRPGAKTGWFEGTAQRAVDARADDRFVRVCGPSHRSAEDPEGNPVRPQDRS